MSRNTLIGLAGSIILHLAVVGLLTISFSKRPPAALPVPAQPEIIQAVAVDEKKVTDEVDRLKRQESERREEELNRKKRAEEELRQAREARQNEERRLKEAKRKAAEAKQKAAEEQRKRKQAEEAEKARLAKLQKEREQLAKKQAEEKRRLEELETQRKIAAEKERQRREEEERKRREAEEKKKREEAERLLQQKLAAEQERLQREHSRQLQQEQATYIALIRDKVERNWLQPPGWQAGTSCTVLVYQLPGGDVINVKVTQSCGNAVFDRSVENAVRKASPLPPPPTPEVFDREIELIFNPR